MKKLLVVIALLSILMPGCLKLGAGGAADNLPRVHVFQVVPDSVEQGKQVVLSWEVSEASSVTIEPGIGAVEPTGSKLVTVTAPTVFKLTATNRYGKTEKPASVAIGQSGGVAAEPPPVQGGGAEPPAAGGQIAIKPEVVFQAVPNSICPGQVAELSWNVKYATSITIDQGIGTVAASSKMTVKPTGTTVYTLTAKNNLAETVSPVTVTFSAAGCLGILPPTDNKSGGGGAGDIPRWLKQPANPPAAQVNWSGKWLCGQWGTLTISQSGDVVTGSYTYDNGKLKGNVGGDKLFGTWSEEPSYSIPNDAGDVEFTMAADGNSFTGRWRYGFTGEWRTWNGQKDLSDQLPPGQN